MSLVAHNGLNSSHADAGGSQALNTKTVVSRDEGQGPTLLLGLHSQNEGRSVVYRVGQPCISEKEGALNLVDPHSEPVLGLGTKVPFLCRSTKS